ncbi:predicted protein [Verticillium alfalfae VaMs.102]|uniref:Predicted protein n=1 Tax=Verticillium alfalfae (strain VaMs.102 / ATCC MYA-4576 / FGSC 10136) TaxID=526221 RepID=C9SQ85_VERA1|nr:predicted protein [Verticillium alfalfae VaMs.102]EEY21010.1 predicted protein [Verticillium alfalfae VaMs.102]
MNDKSEQLTVVVHVEVDVQQHSDHGFPSDHIPGCDASCERCMCADAMAACQSRQMGRGVCTSVVCQWTRGQCFSGSDACAGCWDRALDDGRWPLGTTCARSWKRKSHGPTATVTLIAPPARHGPGVMAGLSQP